MGDCEDKLLISCLDIDENVLSSKAAGVIKRATGEEKISSEAKYKSSKETIVRFKFVFATNFGFTTSRYDAGLVNRILALPFIKETAEDKLGLVNPNEIIFKPRIKIIRRKTNRAKKPDRHVRKITPGKISRSFFIDGGELKSGPVQDIDGCL